MARSVRYRRARHLVSYWTDEGVVTWNYAAGNAVLNDAIVTHTLTLCGDWTPAVELRQRLRPVVTGGRLSAIDGSRETARAFRPAGGSA